eukprot:EG_transcript_8447
MPPSGDCRDPIVVLSDSSSTANMAGAPVTKSTALYPAVRRSGRLQMKRPRDPQPIPDAKRRRPNPRPAAPPPPPAASSRRPRPTVAAAARPPKPARREFKWTWDNVWRMANDWEEAAAQQRVSWLLAEYNREREKQAKRSELLRPDLEAMKLLVDRGHVLHRQRAAGVLPGLPVGTAFMSRAEMHVLGFHFPPVAGIDGVDLKRGQQPPSPPPGSPAFPQLPAEDDSDPDRVTQEHRGGYATCVMVSGQYEDDEDADGGQRFVYTGEGGNALTATKTQYKHQELTKGNLKLLGNVTMHIPVRVVRKNPDRLSYTKNIYVFDGLYWVTRCWKRSGQSGFDVYQYEFIRLPGQPETYATEVHWGNSDGKPLLANFEAERRPGFRLPDISRGLNRFPDGRPNPIPVVNTVDDTPAPAVLLRGDEAEAEGKALLADPTRQAFVYIKECIRASDVPTPAPAPPAACTVENLKHLNGGWLPYNKQQRLWHCCKVVYELPERYAARWSRADAQQAQCVPLGCAFRLEVFRTHNKGWGVRSWDQIPRGAFVAEFTGLIR